MLQHKLPIFVLLLAWAVPGPVSAEPALAGTGWTLATHRLLGAFSRSELDAWEKHGFNGETQYRVVEQNGKPALLAQCDNSSSGLMRKIKIDLAETPIISWSWRVDNVYPGIDETRREGDDYPASIYVAVKTGLTRFSLRVLHYVWASNKPQNSSWDSAFTTKVKQVAVRSGLSSGTQRWYREVRNVEEDFKEYFDIEAQHIDYISLMTDCDNTSGRAIAYYGDILFAPDEESLMSLDDTQAH